MRCLECQIQMHNNESLKLNLPLLLNLLDQPNKAHPDN